MFHPFSPCHPGSSSPFLLSYLVIPFLDARIIRGGLETVQRSGDGREISGGGKLRFPSCFSLANACFVVAQDAKHHYFSTQVV